MLAWIRDHRTRTEADRSELERRLEHLRAVRQGLLADPSESRLSDAAELVAHVLADSRERGHTSGGLDVARAAHALDKLAFDFEEEIGDLRTAHARADKLTSMEREVLAQLPLSGRLTWSEDIVAALVGPEDDRWEVRRRVTGTLAELLRLGMVGLCGGKWRLKPGGRWVLRQLSGT